ncbi:MAG: NACHT domain-containing protein [Magnetococcus sp. DMHC-1]|nr:NACHT domain-containing protein [Magnetococcales bacterium]
MELIKDFSNWQLDLWSVLIGGFVVPTLVLIGIGIRKQVQDWIMRTVEGVLYNIGRHIGIKRMAWLSLKRLARLNLGKEGSAFLPIPSRNNRTLNTDDSFVTLAMDSAAMGGGRYDHHSLLNVGKRLRVIGDPGSGKSSLVKRMFRDACRALLAKPGVSRLPVMLELRKLIKLPDQDDEQTLGTFLYEELKKQISEAKVYGAADCFDIASNTNGVLVLLDGLDEVSSDRYTRISQAIHGLCRLLDNQGENNVLILTMRSQFHQQISRDFENSLPVVMAIQPFSPEDIYTFLSRWPFQKKEERPVHIRRIHDNLNRLPTLREMCRNPLVLSMYVAEDEVSQGAAVPESRTAFYKTVLDELLSKRRSRQGISQPGRQAEHERRKRLLGAMAFEHMLNPSEPTNTLNWQNMLNTCTRILQESGLKDVSPEEYLREIAKETGLISEERPGESWRFIHLTFGEYLAAAHAAEVIEDGWHVLMDKHRDFRNSATHSLATRLNEVLPFAAGLLPHKNVSRVLDDVLSLADLDVQGRVLLETKRYEHACWQQFSSNIRDQILNPPQTHQIGSPRWMDLLRLAITVFQDARNAGSHAGEELFAVGKSEEIVRTWGDDALSALAREDGFALFSMLNSLGLSPLTSYSHILLKAMDQQPLQDEVISLVEREGEKHPEWRIFLIESGMRYSNLAKKLRSTKDVWPWLDKLMVERKKQELWFDDLFIKKNIYTCLVTNAIANYENIKIPDFYLIANLINIKPPNYKFLFSNYLAVMSIAALVILAVIEFIVLFERRIELHGMVGSLIINIMFIIVFFALISIFSLFLSFALYVRNELTLHLSLFYNSMDKIGYFRYDGMFKLGIIMLGRVVLFKQSYSSFCDAVMKIDKSRYELRL